MSRMIKVWITSLLIRASAILPRWIAAPARRLRAIWHTLSARLGLGDRMLRIAATLIFILLSSGACGRAGLSYPATPAPTTLPRSSAIPPTTMASSPATVPSPTPTPRPTVALQSESRLAHGCEQSRTGSRPMVAGELAINFTLKDTRGRSYTLSELLADRPVVMIFGSFT